MSHAKSNQPFMLGYNASGIKSWSPETDPHAKYFRSRVPLAERIPAFAATQANPALSVEPQVMNLSADYDKENVSLRYDNDYTGNLLTFWQYNDLYGAWHGLPIADSPTEEPVYGLINLPNPAYTDAAHRNGVLSLGCWFWPREEEVFADIVEEKADGTFPVADKMIEMAAYFGFDGYFINQEATISEEDSKQLMKMMKYLRKEAPEGFHLQWYDTIVINGDLRYQNAFNDKNDPWIQDEDGNTIIDSMFVNYAFNEKRIQDSADHAKSIGLDPYEVLYPGTENDKYGYNPPYDTRSMFPEGKKALSSWGLFGTDFVWNRYENKYDPDDQDTVYERERRYWTGPLQDPTDPIGRTLYKSYKDPFHAVDRENYRKWDGVAHYIPARSVIGSFPFVTRFNTGHGRKFFVNGEVANESEWKNAGIQDLLPSWQWWIHRFDADNQPIEETRPVPERPLVPSFDYETAFDGGSSLKIAGDLIPTIKTELRLFKTKLTVTEDVHASITYKLGEKNLASHMELGLLFEDEPESFVWVKVQDSQTDGWDKQTIALDAYKGRTIATIGLRFSSDVAKQHVIHIGELAFTEEETKQVDTPTGFTVDESFVEDDSAELFLSWDLQTEDIWYYTLYQDTLEGKKLLGRIYDDVYYIQELNRINKETESTIELVAVNHQGQESKPATTSFSW